MVLLRCFLRLDRDKVLLRDTRYYAQWDGVPGEIPVVMRDVQVREADMATARSMLGLPPVSPRSPGMVATAAEPGGSVLRLNINADEIYGALTPSRHVCEIFGS